MTSEIRYAGFWIRLAAVMIDVVLFSFILMFMLTSFYGVDEVISYLLRISKTAMQNPGSVETQKLGAFHIFAEYIMPFILVLIFWKYRSATPGKMLLGLKIVDSETLDEKLTFKQMIGRYFAYIIPMLPLGLGFLSIAFDSKKQGWHDKLSKTCVIKK